MRQKYVHEIRDPVHVFIRLDTDERKVLDSRFFQRLRNIHQLALTYMVYPGATHRRFEHSLGVMDLASRIYGVVTNPSNLCDRVDEILPELSHEDKLKYWRRVLRMAALCHDLGHLPFSHAAEKDLLPSGWNHERLTSEIIRCDEMQQIWNDMDPPLRTESILKLALGEKKLSKFGEKLRFTNLESILSEIITGDVFGADRIDYLLRDSHHAGVAYGKFDHYRLIDSLRILPKMIEEEEIYEPVLGVDEGGLRSAESLLLARYFMYTQLYFHPVRRIYDIHLKEFMKSWLNGGYFPTDIESLFKLTDNEVTAEILRASRENDHRGHEPARRIITHQHFRLLYKRNPMDIEINPEASKAVFEAACEKFGESNLRFDPTKDEEQEKMPPNFPVLKSDNRISWSRAESEIIERIPSICLDYVFIAPEHIKEAKRWRDNHLREIIAIQPEEA